MTGDAAGWFRRNFPDAEPIEDRCLLVLEAWQRLYNIDRTGRARRDGGFRRTWDGGVEVHLRPGSSLATYDDEGLTRLVVAAHRHLCRVSIGHTRSVLVLSVSPRKADGAWHERHPGMEALCAAEVAAP